ncbi:MAG: DUF839 domain-containing protein [Cyclobacteriaceae bacterium]
MKVIHANRREFIKFFGRSGIAIAGLSVLPGCVPESKEGESASSSFPLTPIQPTKSDDLVLAEGFNYHVITKLGDKINDSETYGDNNDYTAFLPLNDKSTDGLLWVNHENINPWLISGYTGGEKTKEQVDIEMQHVGGSIIRIKKTDTGKWEMVENDPYNRRLTANTKIPFEWDQPIAGSAEAIGTLANCAGGLTPWGTILTCEENYHNFFGLRDLQEGPRTRQSVHGWEKYYDHPPEHYGWVVEVDLKTGDAKKLVGLGRCEHEAAAVHQEDDGICVVYTGDDKEGEHLYKFIGAEANSLTRGTLYVADTENGKWLSLDINEQPILQQNFKDQTDVLVRVRDAAKLVGATPLDRPEDVEIDPISGNTFVTLTNNVAEGNFHGSILKIVEKNGDKRSLEFAAEVFAVGGEEIGFSCPDNLAFDKNGNIWLACDISGSKMNKGEYAPFKNNGLYFIPTAGENAGKAFQIASGPHDCEITGPTFSPDYKTLFVCVQHPGSESEGMNSFTSHWPEGGDTLPRSAVVAIQGEMLDRLIG